MTPTKSFRCPACSEASWRLSVNDSSLRAVRDSSSTCRKCRIVASEVTVVAVERPWESSGASRLKSLPRGSAYDMPQRIQKRNGAVSQKAVVV